MYNTFVFLLRERHTNDKNLLQQRYDSSLDRRELHGAWKTNLTERLDLKLVVLVFHNLCFYYYLFSVTHLNTFFKLISIMKVYRIRDFSYTRFYANIDHR